LLSVSRILFVLALAGFAATAAMADGVDPTVVIRRVDPAPLAITSTTETFDLFATAHDNIFAFQNDTNVTLTSLTLDLFAGHSGLTYSCGNFAGADIFSSCTSSSGPSGATIISFSGIGAGFSGLNPASCGSDDEGGGDDKNAAKDNNNDDKKSCTGGVFSLEFDGIPKGAQVRGTGTVSAPEPMTSVLLLSGLFGLAGLRKRRVS
jgi:hypothetical protein